ncbi:MAG: DUF1284 domain-containing protein [Thermodesulfobacteriota bacterium]
MENHIRLRPHHILCIRFLGFEPPDRGGVFDRVYRETIAMLIAGGEERIEVTRGADAVCAHCSHLENGRCVNPLGDEEKVGRWDARILEGLGLDYGDRMTSGELAALIRNKTPLAFCSERCPWKTICKVFER